MINFTKPTNQSTKFTKLDLELRTREGGYLIPDPPSLPLIVTIVSSKGQKIQGLQKGKPIPELFLHPLSLHTAHPPESQIMSTIPQSNDRRP